MGSCHEIRVGDFDRNGQTDVLITGYSGAAGIRPETYHLFLMRDGTGQPIPWMVFTYGLWDEQDRTDLLDLNRDGRIEVLVASHGRSDEGAYNYWTYQLYEARDGLWYSVTGPHGPATYPVHSKFTFRCHNAATDFSPGKEPRLYDQSNSGLASSPVKITRIDPGAQRPGGTIPKQRLGEGDASFYTRLTFDERPKVTLSDARRCALSPSAGVLHSQAGVRSWSDGIATYPERPENLKLLQRAVANRWPVRVAASLEKGYCFIQHLWVEQP